MKIDHHVHLGIDWKFNYSMSGNEIIILMNRFGIDQSIVFPCPFQDFSYENPYSIANGYVLHSAMTFSNKLIPFMFVHPFMDTKEEVEGLANKFQGYKFYNQAGEYDYRDLSSSNIADYIFNQKKPVVFHIGATKKGKPSTLIDTVDSFPETPFYLAHSGRLFKQDLENLSSRPNVYIDVSPLATMCNKGYFARKELRSPEVDINNPKSVLNYLYGLFGKDRVVWGSDAPWSIKLLDNGYSKEIEILEIMEDK